MSHGRSSICSTHARESEGRRWHLPTAASWSLAKPVCRDSALGSDSRWLLSLNPVYPSLSKWQLFRFSNGEKNPCPLYYCKINCQDFWLRLVIKVKLSHRELPVLDTWDFRLFRSWFYTSSLTFAWRTLWRVSVRSQQLRESARVLSCTFAQAGRGSAWPCTWVPPAAAPSSWSMERGTPRLHRPEHIPLCCLTPSPSAAGASQLGTEEELELGYCKTCTTSWLMW